MVIDAKIRRQDIIAKDDIESDSSAVIKEIIAKGCALRDKACTVSATLLLNLYSSYWRAASCLLIQSATASAR